MQVHDAMYVGNLVVHLTVYHRTTHDALLVLYDLIMCYIPAIICVLLSYCIDLNGKSSLKALDYNL
jgi:hypothetical protein